MSSLILIAVFVQVPTPLSTSPTAADLVQSPRTPRRRPTQAPLRVPTSDAALAADRGVQHAIDADVPLNPLSADDAKKSEARKLLVVAYMYLDQSRHQEALQSLKESVGNDPNLLPALRELAVLSRDLGHVDDAIRYCRRALELDPNNLEMLSINADFSHATGDVAAAIASLEQASKVPQLREKNLPLFETIHVRLAQLYRSRQDFAGVVRTLRTVIDILDNSPTDVDARSQRQRGVTTTIMRVELADALRHLAKEQEALRTYKQAREELEAEIRSGLQDPRVYSMYDTVLKHLGQQDDVLPSLAAALERDRRNPLLRTFYAQKLLESEQYTKAEQVLEPIAARPESLPVLAEVYRKLDQPGKLLNTIATNLNTAWSRQGVRGLLDQVSNQISAIAKYPDLVQRMAEEARKPPKQDEIEFVSNFVVARAASEAEIVELSLEFYERCLKLRPSNIMLQKQVAQVLDDQKRHEKLLTHCESALKRWPDDFDFHELKAGALQAQGKTDDAVRTLSEFIDRTNNGEARVSAIFALGQVYRVAELWDEATSLFEQVIDQYKGQPAAALARYQLSHVYTMKGDMPKAEESLLKLIEAPAGEVPDRLQAAANNDLGYLWADTNKNLEQAEQMIRKALAVDPESAAYLDSMGWVLFKRGKFGEAVEHLKKAVGKEDGGDGVIWDHLGDAYLQNKNVSEARNAWRKAVELYEKSDPDKQRDKIEAVKKKIELQTLRQTPKSESAGN